MTDKPESELKRLAPIIDSVQSAIFTLPRYRDMVYQGFHFDNAAIAEKYLNEHQAGNIVRYSGFTATSVALDVALKIAGADGWVIAILGLSGAEITQFSFYRDFGAREVLFPLGSEFEVFRFDRERRFIALEEIQISTLDRQEQAEAALAQVEALRGAIQHGRLARDERRRAGNG